MPNITVELLRGRTVEQRRAFADGYAHLRYRLGVPLTPEGEGALSITWPLAGLGRAQYLAVSPATASMILPAGSYVAVKRVTVKEEARRSSNSEGGGAAQAQRGGVRGMEDCQSPRPAQLGAVDTERPSLGRGAGGHGAVRGDASPITRRRCRRCPGRGTARQAGPARPSGPGHPPESQAMVRLVVAVVLNVRRNGALGG